MARSEARGRRAVTVSEHQLQLDFDALVRLAERVRAPHRIENGPERLLAHLVRRGLDERALLSAAALVLQADTEAAERRQQGDRR